MSLWNVFLKSSLVDEYHLPQMNSKMDFFGCCLHFYLPHMKYEGSIGLVSLKIKNFYCWFSRFRLKNIIWAKKIFPSVTRRCWTKFVLTLQKSPWKLERWNFGSRSILGQLDALHTQNFEIWHRKGTSHTNFDKTVDAQFGSLAVRRKKNKMTKIPWACMICNMWKVYTRPTCASDFLSNNFCSEGINRTRTNFLRKGTLSGICL
jgi:hypothetical protein